MHAEIQLGAVSREGEIKKTEFSKLAISGRFFHSGWNFRPLYQLSEFDQLYIQFCTGLK